MTRIGTRAGKIAIDGTEFTNALSRAKFTSANGDSNFITFYDAAHGLARAYRCELVTAQDGETGSLYDLMWTKTGEEVPVRIAPYGNVVATEAQPHYLGIAIVGEPDGDLLGGDANPSSTQVQLVELAWECAPNPTYSSGRPQKMTTGNLTDVPA